MNLKKKLLLFMALSMIGFTGCSKDDDSNEVGTATLSVDPATVNEVLAEGATLTFNVTTNQSDLTVTQIEGTESWAHLSGQGNERTLVVDPNTSYTQGRSTTITFKVKAVKTPVRIKVAQAAAVKPEDKPKAFALPSFNKSYVYKIMDGDIQVGEVCREYLFKNGVVDAQAIVVYPMKSDKVDLTKGYVAQVMKITGEKPNFDIVLNNDKIHGGSVSFVGNAVNAYRAGTSDPQNYISVDIAKGLIKGVTQAEAGELAPLTLKEDQLTDGDGNKYGITKIASQYWMMNNLYTTKFRDGTPIQEITSTDAGSWMTPHGEKKALFCKNPINAADTKIGNLYNIYALGYSASGSFGSDILCPTNSHLPSADEYKALLTYIAGSVEGAGNEAAAAKLKVSGSQYWPDFKPVDVVEVNKGTNVTGFSAVATAYRDGDIFDGVAYISFMFSRNGSYKESDTQTILDRMGVGFTDLRFTDYSGSKFGVTVRGIKD